MKRNDRQRNVQATPERACSKYVTNIKLKKKNFFRNNEACNKHQKDLNQTYVLNIIIPLMIKIMVKYMEVYV
jgi:hypothetical protein